MSRSFAAAAGISTPRIGAMKGCSRSPDTARTISVGSGRISASSDAQRPGSDQRLWVR